MFQKDLTEAITQDGFEIRWVLLCGPDHVKVNSPSPAGIYGCNEYIVSDAGRSADFASYSTDGPRTLRGLGAWDEIPLDLEALKKYAMCCASWVCSGLFMLSPKDAQCRLDEGMFIFLMFRRIQVISESRS